MRIYCDWPGVYMLADCEYTIFTLTTGGKEMKEREDYWQDEYEALVDDDLPSAEDKLNAELHRADMARDDMPYTDYIASIRGSVLNSQAQYMKKLEEKNDE